MQEYQLVEHDGVEYRLEERIGGGGFGEVWRCVPGKTSPGNTSQQIAGVVRFHRNTESPEIALKFVLDEIVQHPLKDEFLERFRREATTAMKFDHPNVLTPLFVAEHDGLPFFGMPLCDREPLLKFTDRITKRGRVEVIRKIYDGMNYLHETLGLVHRDLKPQNILLRNSEPVITDFGLAKWGENLLTTGAASISDTGRAMGTFAYMAPEQRVDTKHVDFRADLFSLGLVFYRVLTQQHLTCDDVLAADNRHTRNQSVDWKQALSESLFDENEDEIEFEERCFALPSGLVASVVMDLLRVQPERRKIDVCSMLDKALAVMH